MDISTSPPVSTSSAELRQDLDVEILGQVFTPELVVNCMMGGIRHKGRVLEPSCGNGAFLSKLRSEFNVVGIEMDSRHCPSDARQEDFFAYPITEKFDTIIGNPPYVRYQDIAPSTLALLDSYLLARKSSDHVAFDERTNLYLFFIEKAIRHLNPNGELIFITPRDFFKATSAVRMNRWLFQQGTITHAVELGDAKVFSNAVPNCLIWRFERGNFSRKTYYASVGVNQSLQGKLKALCTPEEWSEAWEERVFVEHEGHLLFTREHYSLRMSSIATVKVGAVSGDDEVFTSEQYGTMDFVCSNTAQSGKTRRMIWNQTTPHPALLPHKSRLLSRRIKSFDEKNWWHWGRGFPQTDAPRIYVNAKTRNAKPFFLHPCNNFDGAVLAVFPSDESADLVLLCEALNDLDWEELGFVCDGRFLFSQRSLENAPLPESFKSFVKKKNFPQQFALVV
jgi:adenine-specific DNA-methyltransferase